MSKPRRIVAKTSLSMFVFFALLGGLFAALAITLLLSVLSPFYSLTQVFIGFGLATLSYFLLKQAFDLNTLIIDGKEITIKNALGFTKETIEIKELIDWFELSVGEGSKMYDKLALKTNKGEYFIYSRINDEYDEVRSILNKFKKPSEFRKTEYKNFYKTIKALAIIAFSIFTSILIFVQINPGKILAEKDVRVIKTKLSDAPYKGVGAKRHTYLEFTCNDYPGLKFHVSDNILDVVVERGFLRKSRGDEITFAVPEKEMMKLEMVTQLPIHEQILGVDLLTVVYVEGFNSLSEYNAKEKDKNFKLKIFIVVLNVFFFSMALYELKSKG